MILVRDVVVVRRGGILAWSPCCHMARVRDYQKKKKQMSGKKTLTLKKWQRKKKSLPESRNRQDQNIISQLALPPIIQTSQGIPSKSYAVFKPVS